MHGDRLILVTFNAAWNGLSSRRYFNRPLTSGFLISNLVKRPFVTMAAILLALPFTETARTRLQIGHATRIRIQNP